MKYLSSRDQTIKLSASQAIIKGLADDGGLFVPEYFPKLELEELKDMDYKDIAVEILSMYFTNFSKESLRDIVHRAYVGKFIEGIAPVKEVGDVYFLELYHGPTLAFKDMALAILPHLLKEALSLEGIDKEVVILTATSGDTGKAALEGFAGVENTRIVVFYPEKGVSQIQKLQMISQEGDNTLVVGIHGNFDNAQTGVKEIFNDESLKRILEEEGYLLSSANSINIGRLIPQIVYYVHAYVELLRMEEIGLGEGINIVVPTGNFGNILAAYYGMKMGLPINKLICASNENNVLTDFFNTGIYDRRRELILTSSPSMDILISSNLERLIYDISGGNSQLVMDKMKELSQAGYYKVDLDLSKFYAHFSSEEEVDKTIKEVFDHYNYLIDTHTAVAYDVYQKYKQGSKDNTKTIIASTASPFKFGSAVAKAIGLKLEVKDEFTILKELARRANLELPKAISQLREKEILHKKNCYKDEMKAILMDYLKAGEKDV